MPRKLKYARRPRYGEKVRCYRNLNNGMISIMGRDGRVIQHSSQVVLMDAQFVVRQAGREKVLREKRKNVHAFVVGSYCDSWQDDRPLPAGKAVTYNPYKYNSFVLRETEKPVKKARYVRIDRSGQMIGVNFE